MKRAVLRLGAFALVVFPACSLISLEHLRGTADGGSGSDAAFDAAAFDAKLDGPYCARYQAPTFCYDFDDKGLAYDYGVFADDASVGFDDAETKSPPFSLRCYRPPSAYPKVYPASGMYRKVATLSQGFDLEFDVRVEAPWDAKNPLHMLTVYFDTADGGTNGDLSFFNGQTRLDVQENTNPVIVHAATRYPVSGVWTHVHLFVDFPGKKLRVDLDGAVALDEALSKVYPASYLEFDLGGLGVNDPPYIAQTVRFDNVVAYVR